MAVKEYKITTGDALFPGRSIMGGHMTAAGPVCREHIEQAVELTAERLPFIRTEITEHDGCLWLRENGRPFAVREGAVPPMPGSEEANGHPVSWSYQGNTLYFSYDHRLCDGHGYAMISQLVQYHYCRLHYGKAPEFRSIIRPDEPFREEEYGDPFAYAGSAQPTGNMDSFAQFMPPDEDFPPAGETLRLRAPLDKFMTAVKKLGASPSSLSVILLCSVLDSLYPGKTAPIAFATAVDFRNIVGCRNTVQNAVITLPFFYTEEIKNKPLAGQITAFKTVLKELREPDVVCSTLAKFQHLYEQKILGRRTGGGVPLTNIPLFRMSYVGHVDRGEMEQYFPELVMDSNYEVMGHTLGIIQQNDCFFFDFISMPKQKEVLAGFRQKLQELDIPSAAVE